MQVARKCGSGWAPGSTHSQMFSDTLEDLDELEGYRGWEGSEKPVSALLIWASAMRRLFSDFGACQGWDKQSFGPGGCIPIGGVDVGGTKRAIRTEWHFHQPLTRAIPAAYDAAVSQFAATSTHFEKSLVGIQMIIDRVIIACNTSAHIMARSISFACQALRIVCYIETSRLRRSGSLNLGRRIDALMNKDPRTASRTSLEGMQVLVLSVTL
jgi:hypothetical protein